MEQQFDPAQAVMEDLARQIAEKSVEASSWKVRAAMAEERVKELEAAQASEEAPGEDGDN